MVFPRMYPQSLNQSKISSPGRVNRQASVIPQFRDSEQPEALAGARSINVNTAAGDHRRQTEDPGEESAGSSGSFRLSKADSH